MAAFRKGLSETGFVEGRNVAIEYRWARRISRTASGIGGRAGPPPGGGHRATGQAPRCARGQGGDHDDSDRLLDRRLTRSSAGLVASLNRPGGNVTGVTCHDRRAWREAARSCCASCVPQATRIGACSSIRTIRSPPRQRSRMFAQRRSASGLEIEVLQRQQSARDRRGLRDLWRRSARRRSWSVPMPFSTTAAISLRRWRRAMRCPRSIRIREFVEAGGLMSYGPATSERISAGRRLCRPHSQGREAGRPAGAAADQVRAGDQSARPPRRSASPCRRRCSPAPTR